MKFSNYWIASLVYADKGMSWTMAGRAGASTNQD